jgi:hypothetical protein
MIRPYIHKFGSGLANKSRKMSTGTGRARVVRGGGILLSHDRQAKRRALGILLSIRF